MKIKNGENPAIPGQPEAIENLSTNRPGLVADTARTTRAPDSVFAGVLGRGSSPADRRVAAPASENATALARDNLDRELSALATQLASGIVDRRQALNRVLDLVMASGPAATLSRSHAEKVRASLTDLLRADPYLVGKLRRLGLNLDD
ncbi:MAG: hypothetical protein V2A73_18700 [Pseudomonadota bacterium]